MTLIVWILLSSMFGMGGAGGIMPGNPSMMMGLGGTPSMMMMNNPMNGGGPGGMMAYPIGAQMTGSGTGTGPAGGPQQQVLNQPLTQNMSTDPTEDQIIETLKIYLSQQDLMKITKRSVREALNHWFPKFVFLSLSFQFF
jgi:chitin synthase